MNDNFVRCLRSGFSSKELDEYVDKKLIALEEKTNIEGLTADIVSIMMGAFKSAEVHEQIEKRKVYAKVPDRFIRVFRVAPGSWHADIPFDVALNAIDKELSALYDRYGISAYTLD